MSTPLKAGKPEKNKENWTRKYNHLHKLHEDTYGLLVKRLKERTIDILDADPELQEKMEDAASGDDKGGSCLGSHMIMDKFYDSRLSWNDLPDTAARHIGVWGTVSFEDTPSIDCIGDVIGGVLKELYILLDAKHPRKKIQFQLKPVPKKEQ